MNNKEMKRSLKLYGFTIHKVPFKKIYYLEYEHGYNYETYIYYNKIFESIKEAFEYITVRKNCIC